MSEPESIAEVAYTAVCGGLEVEEAVTVYGVPLEAIQEVCGDRGHEWTHFEAGDPSTPYFNVGSDFCEICHVDRPEPDEL